MPSSCMSILAGLLPSRLPPALPTNRASAASARRLRFRPHRLKLSCPPTQPTQSACQPSPPKRTDHRVHLPAHPQSLLLALDQPFDKNAPMTASIFWPFLKIMTVGMLRMPYSVATLGLSSVFSFSCKGKWRMLMSRSRAAAKQTQHVGAPRDHFGRQSAATRLSCVRCRNDVQGGHIMHSAAGSPCAAGRRLGRGEMQPRRPQIMQIAQRGGL